MANQYYLWRNGNKARLFRVTRLAPTLYSADISYQTFDDGFIDKYSVKEVSLNCVGHRARDLGDHTPQELKSTYATFEKKATKAGFTLVGYYRN